MRIRNHTAAFTLVEVLVAASLIVVLMGVLLGMTDQTQRLVRSTSAKVEQFQEARVGFESMTRRLAQATLNTYWEYDNPIKPTRYQRSAELRFVSGVTATVTSGIAGGGFRPGHCVFFHAPNGLVENQEKNGMLDSAINVWGYFLEVGTDTVPAFLEATIPGRKRFRLMEAMQPTEQLKTFEFQSITAADAKKWFAPLVSGNNRPVRVLAENIVSLIILPRLSRADEVLYKSENGGRNPVLANRYSYDTTTTTVTDPILNPRNQLPPVVQVVMIAIDEPSAKNLQDRYGSDRYIGIDTEAGLFRDPASLEDDSTTSTANDGDLYKLEQRLINKRVSYRIFSTNVSIRGAKWSRSQSK